MHPLAIRYPRAGKIVFDRTEQPLEVGKWEYLHRENESKHAKITVVASGERCLIIAMKVLQRLTPKGLGFDIVNARFVKPLDVEMLRELQSTHLITIEDNVFLGGLGSMINGEVIRLNKSIVTKNFAYRDEFIPQGSISALQAEYGVNCQDIQEYIEEILK